MQAKPNKEFIHCFPPAGSVQPSPGKQGSVTRNGDSGRQTASLQTCPPPFLLLPPAFYAERDVIWCGMSLRSAGVSCPGHVAPSSLHSRVGCGAEEALALGKHCSAVTQTSLCCQRCFQHKSKT